jgi:hypothetical protein
MKNKERYTIINVFDSFFSLIIITIGTPIALIFFLFNKIINFPIVNNNIPYGFIKCGKCGTFNKKAKGWDHQKCKCGNMLYDDRYMG